MARRCCSRSTRRSTSRGQGQAHRPFDLLHRLPPDGAGAGRADLRRRDPEAVAGDARFYKVAKRRLDDISTVAAAMRSIRISAGRVRQARFAFGGVAATPVRASPPRSVIGQHLEPAAVRARAGGARPYVAAHQRPSRLGGVPQWRWPSRCSRSSGGSRARPRHEGAPAQTVPHESAAGTSPAKRSTPTICCRVSRNAARLAGAGAARPCLVTRLEPHARARRSGRGRTLSPGGCAGRRRSGAAVTMSRSFPLR